MIVIKSILLLFAALLCYMWWRDNIRDRMGPVMFVVSTFVVLCNFLIIGLVLASK